MPDMIADAYPGDSVIGTHGYHAMGDGGQNSYIYRETGRSNATEDGGFYIFGTGVDDYFEALDKSVIRAKQFGARVDGVTDDSDAYMRMASVMGSWPTVPVELAQGKSLCAQTVDWGVNCKVSGQGYRSTYIMSGVTEGTLLLSSISQETLIYRWLAVLIEATSLQIVSEVPELLEA